MAGAASLVMPVWKKLSAPVQSTDLSAEASIRGYQN